MPLIRWGNRAVTAITPHAGNRNVLIPAKKKNGTPPAPPTTAARLDNPVQGGKEVLDQGTEVFSGGGPVPPPDFIIPNTWSYSADGWWDGTARGVQPGDIIELEAGNREAMRIRNIRGTAAFPVIIRSDTAGRTTMRRSNSSSGGFVWWIQDCEHFIIDGSYSPDDKYGIKVTSTASGDAPSAYLQLRGVCSDYTIRNVEIDGNWPAVATSGIGIQHNGGVDIAEQAFIENVLLEELWVHRTRWSGIYMGGNYGSPWAREPNVRNMTIRYCHVNDTGRRSMGIKMGIDGTNDMHHNYCINSGLAQDSTLGFRRGMAFFEGSGNVYNNWLENAGWQGISSTSLYRPSSDPMVPFRCYNNIIVNSGAQSTLGDSPHGVVVSAPAGGFAIPTFSEIYNNTVIDSKDHGVFLDSTISTNVTVQNNIISGSGTNAVQDNSTGTSVTTPNETGSVAAQDFGVNYALTATSPARDAATTGIVPSDDNAGIRAYVTAGANPQENIGDYVSQDNNRPQGADECQGSLEYVP